MSSWRRATLSTILAVVAGCSGDRAPVERTEGYGLRVDEQQIVGQIEGAKLAATFALVPTGAAAVRGELTVALHRLTDDDDAEAIASASTTFTAEGETAKPTVTLDLLAGQETTNIAMLAQLVLRYRVVVDDGSLYGFRSAYDILDIQSLHVVGDDRFTVGETGLLRITASDLAEGHPLQKTPIQVSLAREGHDARLLAQGQTDARGELLARIEPREDEVGPAELVVSSAGYFSRHAVQIERPQRVLLTTDKPLYQPGQTVHLRALVMRQPEMRPDANADLELSVADPKGNEIISKKVRTDGFGIASHTFALADRINLGRYTITISGSDTGGSEGPIRQKTFDVARYRLPKFEVTVSTDRPYFAAGTPITGEIEARYYFGEPVSNAQVTLTATLPFETSQTTTSTESGSNEPQPLRQLIGKTDAEGRYRFELPLSVNGTIQLDVEVEDATGASARATRMAPLGDGSRLEVIPDTATITQGKKGKFYVLLADPAGRPLAGSVALSGAVTAEVEVPASGIAQIEAQVNACQPSGQQQAPNAVPDGPWDGAGMDAAAEANRWYGGAQIEARHGETVAHAPLSCAASPELQLSTDRALYRQGDQATVSLRAPADAQQVILEVLQGTTPIATHKVALSKEGLATVPLELGSALTRTLTLRAFAQVNEQTLAARRLIYVAAADQLKVSISSDRTTYRPGESARVQLQVTDHQGHGTAAALGVQVVDEAVYGLSGVKPGIERSFFAVSDDVVTAGGRLQAIGPEALLVDDPQAVDQLRARALFAAADDQTRFPIDIGARAAIIAQARQNSLARLQQLSGLLSARLNEAGLEQNDESWSALITFERILDDFPDDPDHHDGFGRRIRVERQDDSRIELLSRGMDEAWDTDDDLSVTIWYGASMRGGGEMDMAAAAPGAAEGNWTTDDGANNTVANPTDPAPPSGGTTQRAARRYFPETLFVDPALITDGQGRAELPLQLADSITNWKVTAIAHSLAGQLGSANGDVTVFQPFFIDVMLPPQLMQGDEVSVPVAIYNYLDTDQQVQVSLAEAPWFELLDDSSKTVTLAQRSVGSVFFSIRAKAVGRYALTASGQSATEADSVRRDVDVLPDGKLVGISHSGLLETGAVSHTVTIPGTAIQGGRELRVKVFPGMTSQAVEGFEGMLRQPNGCFEQTSSSTYPNVMILQYLKGTGQVTSQIEQQATDYIAKGYQRLLSFEVPGGGFSLWGDAPASQTLTAFGLMEFSDMAKVRFVDDKMLERTRKWLLARQKSSGAFPAGDSTAHATAGEAAGDEVLSTAYVTWGLIASGEKGEAVGRAINYLRKNSSAAKTAYGIALMATALLSYDADDGKGKALLDQLVSMAATSDGKASWTTNGQSMTYGAGNSMQIETTALALNALLLGNSKNPVVGQSVAHLASKRDHLGGFGTTQSTALALRSMLLANHKAAAEAAGGEVIVSVDGVEQARVSIDAATADMTHVVDLDDYASGSRDVELTYVGKGEIGYQVAGKYWVPFNSTSSSGDLDLSVTYDRQQLSVGQSLTATVALSYAANKTLRAPMVHLGLPPGFLPDDAQLQPDATGGLVKSFEQRGGHLVLYLADLDGSRTFDVPLRATLPLKGKAPASSAYAYYTPEIEALAQTPVISVFPAAQ